MNQPVSANATLYSHVFAFCPHCKGPSSHRVDHLYDDVSPASPRTFGPWYCKCCKGAFEGTVWTPGNVTVSPASVKSRFSRSLALLKLDAVDGTVFFIMDHDRYHSGDPGDDTDEFNQHHQQYFFEEHSCPTNWLNECVAVIKNCDSDPHGFLTFVRAVDMPPGFDTDNPAGGEDISGDQAWAALFPEAFRQP